MLCIKYYYNKKNVNSISLNQKYQNDKLILFLIQNLIYKYLK